MYSNERNGGVSQRSRTHQGATGVDTRRLAQLCVIRLCIYTPRAAHPVANPTAVCLVAAFDRRGVEGGCESNFFVNQSDTKVFKIKEGVSKYRLCEEGP